MTSTVTSTVTSADGTAIAYSTTGEGPAVIVVDGALCHRSFGPSGGIAEQLGSEFTVHTYDRRGRGGSGDADAYSPQREVEDLAALIQAAGGQACVVGFSSGGALALLGAAADIGVTKVACYEAPYVTQQWHRDSALRYTADLHQALDAGRVEEMPALFMTLVGVPAEQVAEMRRSPVWPMFTAVAKTLTYDNAVLGYGAGGAVPTDVLGTIAVPVLAMDGGASPDILRDPAGIIAEACPDGERVTLPEQTHEVSAQVVSPVLAKFFA
ncbi:alpha/beta hydrolase fold protein-1 [Catenulispora acidiphila DSM 44928]|uniref:Alpha/beta hydrolase fold protein-1 n=1 Tax=Catenulispora acidiphila (strain DSM 44928 / JCM 14897 / NBRC 102108 / NRRL B-24433 / ID139908) TaxID=479433 RepID=C7Q7M3_CATAD|nr:alpha/beta hydrolase [Catenulispora acidiphila]ACU72216.1 alpha/beta hydrolase fold protein-1 [Catenulispora acidiphila DSM 44928]